MEQRSEIKNQCLQAEKAKLLDYLEKPVTTSAQNSMGCSENWYNPFFAVTQTFSKEEIEAMSEQEVCNLMKLAEKIADGLY